MIMMIQISTSDPFVIVCGMRNDRAVCLNKTRVIDKTLNPAWNQDLVISEIDGSSLLTLTVLDHDAIGHDDFLGQVVIDLNRLPNSVLRGEKTEIAYDIGRYVHVSPDSRGTPRNLGDANFAGQGKLWVSVSIVKAAECWFGWMHQFKKGLFGRSSWEQRYVTIINGNIAVHENPLSLHKPDATYEERDVVNVEKVTHDGKVCLRVTVRSEKEPVHLQLSITYVIFIVFIVFC